MAFSSSDTRNYLAVGKQTDFDTPATTFKFVRYLGDSGITNDMDTETVYEGGDGQDPGLVYKSRVRADGQINAYARPDVWTWAAAFAMGSAAVIGTNAGVGTSIFVPNATVPYLTIEQAWGGGNQIDRVTGAILSGFQVEGGAGEPWRLTLPFIGGGTPNYRDGAASGLQGAITLETGDPAMYAGGAYLINGATTLDIRRFSVNFSRNVDADLYTTQVYRRKVVPLSRSLEVTFQLIFQDATIYKQVQYNGGSTVVAELATGAFHAERILTSSQMLAVDVPNLKYTGVSVNRLEPDGQTVVMDISAMGQKVGTSLMQLRSIHSGITATGLIT